MEEGGEVCIGDLLISTETQHEAAEHLERTVGENRWREGLCVYMSTNVLEKMLTTMVVVHLLTHLKSDNLA